MRALIFCLIILTAGSASAAESTLLYQGRPEAVDGDSLMFGNTEMRLLCIDAVELHQTCARADGSVYDCGELAKQAIIAAIGGRVVRCRGKIHDKYNRPLVTCRAGKTNLNNEMVKQGWAIGTCRKSKKLAQLAQAQRLNIWQGDFMIPHDWRVLHPWHKLDEVAPSSTPASVP